MMSHCDTTFVFACKVYNYYCRKYEKESYIMRRTHRESVVWRREIPKPSKGLRFSVRDARHAYIHITYVIERAYDARANHYTKIAKKTTNSSKETKKYNNRDSGKLWIEMMAQLRLQGSSFFFRHLCIPDSSICNKKHVPPHRGGFFWSIMQSSSKSSQGGESDKLKIEFLRCDWKKENEPCQRSCATPKQIGG